jgi:hypothetical protein
MSPPASSSISEMSELVCNPTGLESVMMAVTARSREEGLGVWLDDRLPAVALEDKIVIGAANFLCGCMS